MNQTEKIKNRVDYKTLVSTLAIQTKSLHDEDMLTFIKEKLALLDVDVQEDGYGNIYVTKGTSETYACVVAHTDTVQDMLADINIYRNDDTIFAFNPVDRRQWGIGGDDKVGVYITLQLLQDIPILKAVFFRDEEIGCRGSHYSMKNHSDWYKDCGYVLMADRRGNKDVVTVSGGVIITSEEFLEACDPIFDKYGYKDVVGISSDIDVLTSEGIGVSTVNLSCGYHEPHSSREVVSISDVNCCYNMMYDILTEHPHKRFAYVAKVPSYKSSYRRAGNSYKETMLNEIAETGLNSKVGERQLKLYAPLVLGSKPGTYDNFVEREVLKSGKRIYSYVGVKAPVLVGDTKCSKCKTPVIENMFWLPYEGRMYCSGCNYYVEESKVPALLQHLEVDDHDVVFVYSLYSQGWLKKEDAKWNDKLTSWISTQVPF